MSLKYGTTDIESVVYNNTTVNQLKYGASGSETVAWCRPFTLTISPGTGTTLSVSRTATDAPGVSTGVLSSGATIYYGDTLTISVSNNTGYTGASSSGFTSGGVVTNNVTISSSANRISGTYTAGTLPTDNGTAAIASMTCYRKPWNSTDNTYSIFTGTTIYYGDSFYWTASPTTPYNNPSITKTSESVYTWTGAQGGTLNGVTVSGIAIGSRKSYTITFTKPTYGSWANATRTAYYGDIISSSGTTVTCKKWDSTSTNRWSNTATADTNTDEYTYSVGTISGGDISSVTNNATITISSSATKNKYAVNIGTTTNCKASYLSTNSTATSGSSSGTAFDYGSTVYLFVTLSDNNAQFTYTAPSGWTNISGRTYRVSSLTVGTSNTFGAVSATATTNSYTVTASVGNYANFAFLSTNASATSGSTNGSSFNYGSTVYVFVSLYSQTDQYTYTKNDNWTAVGSYYRAASVTVTGTSTPSTGNATRTERSYTVTFAKGGSSYGSWSKSSITAPYSASVSRSGDTVTVGSSGSSTFTNGSATGYTYSVSYSGDSGTVGTGKTITATTSRTAKTTTIRYGDSSGYNGWTTSPSSCSFGSTATIGYSSTGSDASYNYSSPTVNVYSGTSTSGTYLGTATSNLDAYTKGSSYYDNLYLDLVYSNKEIKEIIIGHSLTSGVSVSKLTKGYYYYSAAYGYTDHIFYQCVSSTKPVNCLTIATDSTDYKNILDRDKISYADLPSVLSGVFRTVVNTGTCPNLSSSFSNQEYPMTRGHKVGQGSVPKPSSLTGSGIPVKTYYFYYIYLNEQDWFNLGKTNTDTLSSLSFKFYYLTSISLDMDNGSSYTQSTVNFNNSVMEI